MLGQMRFATRQPDAHSPLMILRLFTIAAVVGMTGCASPKTPQPARKPGFLERAWNSTQKGSQVAWETTKGGASKAKELVVTPFAKGKKSSKVAASKYRELETSVVLRPDVVRLSTTHALEAVVLVANKSKHSLQLSFATSQHIEVVVKTEAGNVIQRWSDDQRVEREPSFIAINPGERLEYTATISTRNMVVGKTYIIEASVPGYDAIFARKVLVPQS